MIQITQVANCSLRKCNFRALNSNFPAIDFIWKHDRTVWGVQVHVTAHADVLWKFKSMCLEAQWKPQFDTIYLLYLSPEQKVANLELLTQLSSLVPSEIDAINIEIIKVAKDDLTCLDNLLWPEGCSLQWEHALNTRFFKNYS